MSLRKQKLPKETPLALNELLELIDANFHYFDLKWQIAAQNERIKRALNFTEEEIEAIENQGRFPYSLAFMTQKLNQFITYQRNNRTEFDIKAKFDVNDEIKAEIANIQFKDLEQRENLVYQESDVYDSGLTVFVGVWEVGTKFDKASGYQLPYAKKIDYKDVIWDANARDYEKNESLFFAKKQRILRRQIIEEYGEEASNVLEGDDIYNWGRELETFYLIRDAEGNRDLDVLNKITLHLRVIRDYYVVLFNDYLNLHGLKGKIRVFESTDKKEAEEKLYELMIPYLDINADLGEVDIIKDPQERLDRYVFTYNQILEYEETEREYFPYTIFQSFHFENEIWTLADLVKAMQTFIDRYLMQVDYSLGKDIKDVIGIDETKIDANKTPNDIIQQMQEDGVIFTKGNPNDVVKNLSGQGANPQWLQMLQWMLVSLTDLLGGKNFHGSAEGSNQSGKSAQVMKEQGEDLAGLFLDNLRRAKLDLGKKLLWEFKTYDSAERVIRIVGDQIHPLILQFLESSGLYQKSFTDIGAGYVTINKDGLSHLQDTELELFVTDSKLSETKKDKKIAQLLGAANLNPQIGQIPEFLEIYLKNIDLDFEDRQKLLQGYANQLQQQAVQAEQEKKENNAKEFLKISSKQAQK